MTLIVRDLRAADPADAEAFADVRRRALPFMVSTAESLLHDVTHATPEAHYRQLVAEADGEVIGTAQLGIADDSPVPGQGYLNVYVHPDHLRRGAGALLARTAEERLTAVGAWRLLSWVLDTPENRAFARRRGYTPSRSARFLRLDLAHGTLPPLPS
ncbi:GNAT family N-acetyltransferase, partial [Streptomyces sp. MB09-02B]|uniref:GNAT family N-acetyltransferase n=1 Tax=Streptomyces sp. MB09-02B TaxID=3028667 RepID=UPI0029AE8034